MNEVFVTFGSENHLAGTLTLPTRSQQPVALLLLNAGVIQRMGPHRINVKIARRVAQQGIVTLRFDFPGQGESGSVASTVPFERQAMLDVQAAMDHVQRATGIQRFAIAGICSGAHHGVTVAHADSRIVGLWMLDGFFYPTFKTGLHRLKRRLSLQSLPGLGAWAGAKLAGSVRAAALRLSASKSDEDQGSAKYPFPPRKAYAATMNQLVDRGVDMALVFSGSMKPFFNYAGQLRDAFPDDRFVDKVHCRIEPGIDHTLTTLTAQKLCIDEISAWLDRLCLDESPGCPPGR